MIGASDSTMSDFFMLSEDQYLRLSSANARGCFSHDLEQSFHFPLNYLDRLLVSR